MSGVALNDRASKAAEEYAVETSSRLHEAMEAAGVPEEDTIEEQQRRQRTRICHHDRRGDVRSHRPAGISRRAHDPVPMPGQMPGIYSMTSVPTIVAQKEADAAAAFNED